jgi:hypothetical protein
LPPLISAFSFKISEIFTNVDHHDKAAAADLDLLFHILPGSALDKLKVYNGEKEKEYALQRQLQSDRENNPRVGTEIADSRRRPTDGFAFASVGTVG